MLTPGIITGSPSFHYGLSMAIYIYIMAIYVFWEYILWPSTCIVWALHALDL